MYHETRLTQPKRAAQPSNEIQSTNYYVRNYQRNMQNKPNSLNVQIYINIYDTKDYKNFIPLAGYKNKPNSNPIKPNCRRARMNVNSLITKDYRKNDDFAVQKNKPNSNPISVKPKMSVNLYVIEDYENETAFRLQKNKPNQTQSVFLPSSNEYMFISKTAKKSCVRLWALLQCFSENFNKPGEQKAECSAQPKLRDDPMNLLGIMPAKEGKIVLKHSFLSAMADYGSAFFSEPKIKSAKSVIKKGNERDRDRHFQGDFGRV